MSGPTYLFDRGPRSLLVLTGSDAASLVQRMITNDFEELEPGRGALAYFLERSGRLVDRVLVLAGAGADSGASADAAATAAAGAEISPDRDALLLLGSGGRAPALAEWIRRHVITEDVDVEDATDRLGLLSVVGPDAAAIMTGAFGDGAADLAPYEHFVAESGAARVRVIRAENMGGRCYHLIAPTEEHPALRDRLSDLPVGGEGEWTAARVVAGVPEWGAELDERTMPLELGEDTAISFTKGCYIGQEVVARLHRTGRSKHALVRAAVTGDAPPAPGAILTGADPPSGVGRVTSAAAGPVGGFVLLARVRSEHAAPGTSLVLRDESPDSRTVIILPRFPTGDPE